MGPKKKKEKKASSHAGDASNAPSEWDSMDLESIRETVPMVRQHLEKAMMDRNYVQVNKSYKNY